MKKFKSIIAVCLLFTIVFVVSFTGFKFATRSVFTNTIVIPNTPEILTRTSSTTGRFKKTYTFNPHEEDGNIKYLSINAYGKDGNTIISGLIDGQYETLVECSATSLCQYELNGDILESYQVETANKGEINIIQGYIE